MSDRLNDVHCITCFYCCSTYWYLFVCHILLIWLCDSPLSLWRLRRPDQWQWAFHLRSSRSRGQVPQRRQLGLLPLFPQQPALPIITATLWHVGRDAIRPEPPARGLQEQPLSQPAAPRHRWPHHGVQPGSARQQVRVGSYLQDKTTPLKYPESLSHE